MYDVKKYITPLQEEDGPQRERERVQEAAHREGVALTDAHWEVIRYLHSFHRQHDDRYSVRELVVALEAKFGAKGGRRYLYQLFPGGPVTQGCRIARLPVPGRSADPSFGSSF